MTAESLSTYELNVALVEERRRFDSAEGRWLLWLAEFDSRAGWAYDGAINCVDWLKQRCGMAFATAKEKVRVALELVRRPLLAAALLDGRLSYSKVRVLTRILNPTEETEQTLIATGVTHSAADLVRVVEHYKKLLDQDRPPKDREDRQEVRCVRRWDGLSTIEVCVPTDMEERIMRILDTGVAAARRRPVDEAPAGAEPDHRAAGPVDEAPAGAAEQSAVASVDGPVDEAPAGAEVDPLPKPSWNHQRADVLYDLLEAGLHWLGTATDIDTTTATVEVVVDYDTLVGEATTPGMIGGGHPLTGDAARRLACDAGICRIITRGASEILDQGRLERHWNRAQRRAIRYRHGNRCAFNGCDRRIIHVHHAQPWTDDGPTDLDAGIPLCWGHHHLVHEGRWTVRYNTTDHTTHFHGPHGQHVITPPRTTHPGLAA